MPRAWEHDAVLNVRGDDAHRQSARRLHAEASREGARRRTERPSERERDGLHGPLQFIKLRVTATRRHLRVRGPARDRPPPPWYRHTPRQYQTPHRVRVGSSGTVPDIAKRRNERFLSLLVGAYTASVPDSA